MVVLLECGTTGETDYAVIGNLATVEAKDENGNFVQVTDTAIDILED
jgi:hypothetical protein